MTNLHIVDVKHGNAAVLVDTNQTTVFDVGTGQRLYYYLLQNNITNISSIIISHTDSDHIGGLTELILSEQISINTIYINPDPTKNTETWRAIKSALKMVAESGKVKVCSIHKGTSHEFESGSINIEIRSPDTETALTGIGGTDTNGAKIDKHSLNVVVRLSISTATLALLPGDIDSDGLALIESNKTDIDAEVLIFPHHGGKPGNSDPVDFTKNIHSLVKPNYVVFSVGDKSANHPRAEIIDTLLQLDSNCVFLSTGNSIPLVNLIKNNSGCNHKNSMGSIVFDFSNAPIILN